jgi:hypothetical protein
LSLVFDASDGEGMTSAGSGFSPKIRAVSWRASLSRSTHSGTILLAPWKVDVDDGPI